MSPLVLIFTLLLLYYTYKWMVYKPKNFPPGKIFFQFIQKSTKQVRFRQSLKMILLFNFRSTTLAIAGGISIYVTAKLQVCLSEIVSSTKMFFLQCIFLN